MARRAELVHVTPATPATPGRDTWTTLAGAWLASFQSPHTRTAYRSDLQQFATWLTGVGNPNPLTATRAAIDAYARHLDDRGLAPATRARRLAALSSFYDYAAAEGVTDRNPAAHVRRPKGTAESPRLGMTATEAAAVLHAADQATPTHRALIALCFLTGLRVSEALSITPSSIRDEAGHRVLDVLGKGGKRSTVALSPLALRMLTDALDHAGTGPVVGTINRGQAARMVAQLGRAAGLPHRLVPHDLRHACATLALEAGAPLHRVQDMLRHASPTTTQRYTAHRDRLDNSAAYTLAGFVTAS